MKTAIILFAFCVLVSEPKAQVTNLELLAQWMEGNFSSEEQSKQDTSFLNIHLTIARIWNQSKDTIWLYVKQSVATDPGKPYGQRIYQLFNKDSGTLVSRVYQILEPLRFANQHMLSEKISTDSLLLKVGCEIFIRRTAYFEFSGSTQGKDCQREQHGASYATGSIIIRRDGLISWDRGYNENDEQVWGSRTGGYRFSKNFD